MELLNLNSEQLLMAAGAAGAVAGLIVGVLLGRAGGGNSRKEDPRNHQIRELEADLRSTRRQLTECEEELEATNEEFKTSVATLQHMRTKVAEKESQITQLEYDLKGSVEKTRQLRTELQDRAAEGLREHVRAKEAETELEVAKAGSEAVMSEITRLQEERKQMTSTMKALGDQLIPVEEIFDSEKDDY